VLAQLTTLEPSTGFTEEQWATTYNGEDLRPDEITKTLDQMFTYDETKNHFKYNGAFETNANVNLFKVIGVGGGAKGNFAVDELIETLKKHGISSSFRRQEDCRQVYRVTESQ